MVSHRWRHLWFLRFHGRFKVLSHTLLQTLFLPNHIGDLTQIHTQGFYWPCHYRVSARWHHLSLLGLKGHKWHFHENRYFSQSSEWISFKLVHKVHQVGVYIGSLPGGATCDIWDFMGVLGFQVTLCAKRYFSQTIWGIRLKFIHRASMDPAITGSLPGGATYHGWAYKVISDIFTKIAISPKVLSGFHSNLYTRSPRLVCI